MAKQQILSYFIVSPHADKIMKVIDNNLGQKGISKKMIYESVFEIDPEVPKYHQFLNFLKNIEKERQRRAMVMLESMKDISGFNEIQLFDTALDGLLSLGNAVIEETAMEAKELIKAGKPIPDKMRRMIMDWFFKGVDSGNKSKLINLKAKEGHLLETLVENLMTAAQYQKLRGKDEVIEGEFEEKKIKKELIGETVELYGNKST